MSPFSPSLLLGSVLLDLIFGDPRWQPHPVVFIGRLIRRLESFLRRVFTNERLAGLLLVVLTVGITCTAGYLLLQGALLVHPLASDAVGVFLGYTCLAANSLHGESARVKESLERGDLRGARQALSMIVGRDTEGLEEPEIWRGVVETVAENTSDGVIAPLFFLMLGGPLLALAYKAVNTLDSMVGYKNERYFYFGWASARFDDLCNWLPARLTAILMIMASPLVGLSGGGALRIMRRDGRNHSSPNSGMPEAAAAGALGVQLGGVNRYFGRSMVKPTIGDQLKPLDVVAWRGTVRLMYGAECLLIVGWLIIVAFSNGFAL